jgi:hypothetical protein
MMKAIICVGALLFVGTAAHGETRQLSIMIDPFTTVTGKLDVPSESECTETSSASLQTKSCKTPGAELQLNGPNGVTTIVISKSQLLIGNYSGRIMKEFFFEGTQDLAGQEINVGVQFVITDDVFKPGALTFNRGKTSYPLVITN